MQPRAPADDTPPDAFSDLAAPIAGDFTCGVHSRDDRVVSLASTCVEAALPHPGQAPGFDQLGQGRVLEDVPVSDDEPLDRKSAEGLQRP